MERLRVTTCEHTEQLVVQVLDDTDEWMCCHNNDGDLFSDEIYEEDVQMDEHDVNELLRDPSGEDCNWCNPYLRRLQKEGINYKEY